MKNYEQLHVRYFTGAKKFGQVVGSYRLLGSDKMYMRESVVIIRQDVRFSDLIEALYG